MLWGMGGQVIKCGLGPILVDLMDAGYVQGVATNGSVPVHDFEIAAFGQTSEDVDQSLPEGQFGVTEETGAFLNAMAREASVDRRGLGHAIGRGIVRGDYPHAAMSVFAQAHQRNIPTTVHVSLGCDVWHIHPDADGSAMGTASHDDFLIFGGLVEGLNDGGVFLNVGSAVVLPEVFLKAVTVVRNHGHALKTFTTANFDFLQHYRPSVNVVKRPVAGHGRGYALTGHHEIMIPLLAAGIRVEAARA